MRRSRLGCVVGLLVGAFVAGCTPASGPGTAPWEAPVTSPPPGQTGASPGCGVTTRGPVTDQAEAILVAGMGRRYTITIPPNHRPGTTEPIPLVLDFHGLIEGLAGTHPFATQLSTKAAAEGFAVVYPIGGGDGVYWDVAPNEDNVDLQFVDALVATIGASACIDRSRMYITGLSFGASMTSMLMCMRANTFAAAAPVAGIRNVCQPTERSIPFVTFHGTADAILPFERYVNTPQAIATKYGCASSSTTQTGPDPVTGGPIRHTVWDCDAVGTAAEFYVIEGGGHVWPGSWFFGLIAPIVGPTPTSLDATDVMWDFFEQHSLPDKTAG